MDEPSSSSSTTLPPQDPDTVPAHHAGPVVAFIIGLGIILLASIMNAAGLNLTKLDHVRTSAVPKASRRKDWLRPLWLLGMLLYILSQLIGSTLALEYMRAEYVAPLGSTSLVFNFLFARFLVGTPVTSNDIYGTIIVVLGVVGIVAFGSINSGLATETDVDHLTFLWRRGGWLGFFFAMTFALLLLLLFTYKLDAVLASRSDISAVPFAGMEAGMPPSDGTKRTADGNALKKTFAAIKYGWEVAMLQVTQWLEAWTAAKDDTTIAWTLGIGWACCGGGLAGGCLVFAKATVKLLSGSISHENPGNQFGHAAPIFTIILLAITAVLQIICLNRGLKVYDSTLVVPVFYGVYTATGFLDSLIFNNEVDAYKSWTLFLIFVSILILISGVVLLTHKKPDAAAQKSAGVAPASGIALQRQRSRTARVRASTSKVSLNEDDGEGDGDREHGEEDVLWAVGDASDDEDDGEDDDIDHHQHPLYHGRTGTSQSGEASRRDYVHGEEGVALIDSDDTTHDDNIRGRASSLETVRPQERFRDEPEEFGEWAKVRPD